MTVDWDAWRDGYRVAPFDEQQAFYDAVAPLYPDQTRFDYKAVWPSLVLSETVTEIGGWRGELAAMALPDFEHIIEWRNYEICPWAVIHSVDADPDVYCPICLEDWPWNLILPGADLLVMSHVVEHMLYEEFCLLGNQFNQFSYVYIDAPLPEAGPADWRGYEGTHIFEAGWKDIRYLLREKGFTPWFSLNDAITFRNSF